MFVSENFKRDIQGKDTNILPVVKLSPDPTNNSEAIYCSLNNKKIGGGVFALPILLNIPSLKESIDIEKRNYKISNITIELSNYEYEGVRFSERVAE